MFVLIMKVSIIVPIYNVSEYIGKCMQSIASQTYRDFEVILVDDCGADDSVEKAVSVLQKSGLSYKLLHHDFNRGLSAARNTGMAKAEGEYVYFLDSDDSISPDCLKLLVEAADCKKVQMVVGGVRPIGNSQTVPLLGKHRDYYKGNEEIFDAYISSEFYVMAWNKLVRRDFLSNHHIEFVDGLVHEDIPWSFEVASKLDSIAIVNKETYNYLIRENSLQTDKNFNRHFGAYKIILRELAHIAEQTGKYSAPSFLPWYEKQKALFFAQTLQKASKRKQKDIYKLIRNILPVYKFSKKYCHYLFPAFIGFNLYKKFFGYHLC